MKVYISVDIEGVAGATSRDEINPGHAYFQEFRRQMTAEAAAACEGARKAGAEEMLVNDAHGWGRTIEARGLPKEARLIRGWRNDPMAVAQLEGLDESFDAILLVGAHARAASGGSPLAHTLTSAYEFVLNGDLIGEPVFDMHAAALVGVPVVFVSGDEHVCLEAQAFNPGIVAVPVKQGIGDSTVSVHPEVAAGRIREGAEKALSREVSVCLTRKPDHFVVERRYREARWAFKASFYPGARLKDERTVVFETRDFYEVLRMQLFTG
jgi:D-amino peptidase